MMQEMVAEEKATSQSGPYKYREFADTKEFADDPDLEQLHRDRMEQMKKECEKRASLQQEGHGELTEIEEKDFLPEVTKPKRVVVHFYHNEFERCKIMNQRLSQLAPRHLDTKFVKIHAPDAPFFVTKLKVQVLPCVISFDNGKAFDRVVGFDELGGKDDFGVDALEQRLLESGAISEDDRSLVQEVQQNENIEPEQGPGKLQKGLYTAASDSDEASDFDE